MEELRSNNDLLESMMENLNRVQKENKDLVSKLKKAEAALEVGHLKTKEIHSKTKDESGKLTKVTKEWKEKLDATTKSLKDREAEISELKERLNLKFNIDEKERQQVIQNFRKFQSRKPNSTQDHKTMQLIQYYDTQIQKRDAKITQLSQELSNSTNINLSLKRQLISKENDINYENVISKTKSVYSEMDQLGERMDVDKMGKELDRKSIMIERLRSELKELRGKYEELTRDYYQVFNQLEDSEKTNKRRLCQRDEDEEMPQPSQLPVKCTIGVEEEYEVVEMKEILGKLMEVYGVHRRNDLVCSAIAADMALKNLPKMEEYLLLIKQFLERVLKVRVNFLDLQSHLDTLESIVIQKSSFQKTIKTIFSQLSLTSDNYLLRITELKHSNLQFISNLKTISYTKELSLAKQIEEFIHFFNLDPNQPLGGQVLDLYEQLKSLNKFVSLCNRLLDVELGVPECLEHVVQVIQRMSSEEGEKSEAYKGDSGRRTKQLKNKVRSK